MAMNIGVGSIITNGLGGPACNLLILGPFRLFIDIQVVTPTPTPTVTEGLSPTPTPTITPTVTTGLSPTPTNTVTPTLGASPTPTTSPTTTPAVGNAVGAVPPRGRDDDDDSPTKRYNITFIVKFSKEKTMRRTFEVDEKWKNVIVKRTGQINRLQQTFKTKWSKIKKAFKVKWKS